MIVEPNPIQKAVLDMQVTVNELKRQVGISPTMEYNYEYKRTEKSKPDYSGGSEQISETEVPEC